MLLICTEAGTVIPILFAAFGSRKLTSSGCMNFSWDASCACQFVLTLTSIFACTHFNLDHGLHKHYTDFKVAYADG